MKFKLGKRLVSIILSLCMIFSMIAVATTSTSAFVVEYAVTQVCDKLVDLGLRGACLASDVLADSLGGEGAECVSTVKNLLFMSAGEVATAQCIELCNQILDEIDELEATLTDYVANTNSLIAKNTKRGSFAALKTAWENDVEKIIGYYGLNNIVSNYRFYTKDYVNDYDYNAYYLNYINAAKAYRDNLNSEEPEKSEKYETKVKEAEADFLEDIRIYVAGNKFTATEDMYKNYYVNSRFESAITELAQKMDMTECVVNRAAQYAMDSCPFSHQQYAYIVDLLKTQIMVLNEVELAYNEYLALQSEYLSGCDDPSIADGSDSGRSFEKVKRDAYYIMFTHSADKDKIDGAAKNIISMIDGVRTIDVNGAEINLSLSDYMKPEDVATINLQIQQCDEKIDYTNKFGSSLLDLIEYYGYPITEQNYINYNNGDADNRTINVKFKRVMSYGGGKKQVYYILDPSQLVPSTTESLTDEPNKPITMESLIYTFYILGQGNAYFPSCDYVNLTQKDISDGANTFKSVASANDLESLFDTLPFVTAESNPSNYLITSESLIPASNTFILTSEFDYPVGDDLIEDLDIQDRRDKHKGNNASDFNCINANTSYPGTSVESLTLDAEDDIILNNAKDYYYTVILKNTEDVYKQNAHLSADEHFTDAQIIKDDTVIKNGESAAIESGNELKIKVKPEAKYTIKSIKCIRNNDVYGNASNAKVETELLNEGDIDMYTPDEDGYYTITYPMPYSDATFVVETKAKPIEKDENGNYIIKTYDDLCTMALMVNSGETEYVEGRYVLANDITVPENAQWTEPIGCNEHAFSGVFDGQGYSIYGLNTYLKIYDGYDFGLFTMIKKATVKNLHLENVNFSVTYASHDNAAVGSLCGTSSNSVISNCTVSGRVEATNASYVAGMCGYSSGDTANKLEKCINYSAVKSDSEYIGGLVGFASSTTVDNCANNGSILSRGSTFAGGLMGRASKSYISNCYISDYPMGTFLETVNRVVKIAPGASSITNCYVIDTNPNIDSQGTVCTIEQFESGEVTYLLNNGVTDGTQVWYQNVDYKEPYDEYPHFNKTDSNTVYKVDKEDKTYSNDKDYVPRPIDIDENGNFIIKTYDDLCTMAVMVNSGENEYVEGSYVLANDITINKNEYWNTPIGTQHVKFSGTFDGQGYKIIGLKATKPAEYVPDAISPTSYMGLFGYIDGATITNLELENVNFNIQDYEVVHLGALCAMAFSNNEISKCIVSGDINIKDAEIIGGLVGTSISGKTNINNCANKADITIYKGYSGGGIVGGCDPGTSVSNCYNIGKINKTSLSHIGYIMGERQGKITNCYVLDHNQDYSSQGVVCTIEQFESGEVTYLLNNGVTDGTQVWYQNVDYKEPYDKYPHFNKTDNNTVYKVAKEDKTYSNTSYYLPGDTDLSGDVNIMDATIVQMHCAKLYELTGTALVNADTVKDNVISISDATMIQAYIAGLVPEL